jgi:hypothetical protein
MAVADAQELRRSGSPKKASGSAAAAPKRKKG